VTFAVEVEGWLSGYHRVMNASGESDHLVIDLQSELRALGAETEGQRRAKRILPWIGSVSVHLFLIFVGFLIPWTTQFFLRESEKPVAIVADFQNLTPGVPPLNDAQSAERNQDLEALQPDLSAIEVPSPLDDLLRDSDIQLEVDSPFIDADSLRGLVPSGSGDTVSFGGLRGSNARNIVYVVDASGSMMPYLPIVIDELLRSIDQLTEAQNFSVIFFQNNEAILVPGPNGRADPRKAELSRRSRQKLLIADEENKLFVFDWINLDRGHIRATGKSNPIRAIELALDGLQPEPDVVFILSTDITGIGEFEVDQGELLNLIDRLNSDRRGIRKAVIKTIQFIDQDPLETLKKIAERNGGADGYRFLSRKDLGLN